jgi:glucose-6-phosphate isomerase
LLPAYLQQLMMESNGKGVRRDGVLSPCPTSPVIWGGVGTDGQHAFFQLLHQGTARVPLDLIVPMASETGSQARHDLLVANAFAQAEALMRGRSREDAEAALRQAGMDDESIATLAPQQVFPGSRPSNMLLLERVDARSLGALIALFEHRVFVQAAVWGINPFDQMGVELGKQVAGQILAAIEGGDELSEDPTTRALIARYLQAR